jgi:hypothetical protein
VERIHGHAGDGHPRRVEHDPQGHGVRPNTLVLSADAKLAVVGNAEVRGYLPSTQMGPATLDQLKQIFEVENIVVGDGIYMDANDVGQDIWGNNAVLASCPRSPPEHRTT